MSTALASRQIGRKYGGITFRSLADIQTAAPAGVRGTIEAVKARTYDTFSR